MRLEFQSIKGGLSRKMLSEYFIGSNAEKTIKIKNKTFVIPLRLLLLLAPPIIFRTYYVYMEQRISNPIHLMLDPTFFLIGIFVIYPAVRTFFDESPKGYLSQLIETLNSISRKPVRFKFSKLRSNIIVIFIDTLLWIVWMLGLVKLNVVLTPALIFMTAFYMVFWLPVFSALHYIYSLTRFVRFIMDETNVENLEFKPVFRSALARNTPIINFVKFKKQLEMIFAPIIRVVLKVLTVVLLASVAIIIIYALSRFYLVPYREFLGIGYAAALILVFSLFIFGWFVYVVIKLSMNLKEILLIELKELKLDRDINDKDFLALQEIDNIISDTSILLLPSKTLLEIVMTFLTMVMALLTILQLR